MRQKMSRLYNALIFVVLFLLPVLSSAQQRVIKGNVTDSRHKPLPYVNIILDGTNEGTTTNEDGNYELQIPDTNAVKILFTSLGYKPVTKLIRPGGSQVVSLSLISDERSLDEVVVKPKKYKYRNKNNPAVALIDLVVAHKAENRLTHYDYVAYRQYEKMTFSMSNTAQKLRKNIFFRKYKFMTDHLDTLTVPGKALMPWYMQERSSEVYYRHNPEKSRQIITGDKKVDFGEFVDNKGLNAYMKHMYQDIDIYKNNIYVVTNQFLSPIADLAPTFYKYFITDTIVNNGDKWVELSFFPRNKSDFLFQGKLYVTLDGRYAVPKVDMGINKNINLNWVKNLNIILNFNKGKDGAYELSKSILTADFGLLKSSNGGIFGKREVNFTDYIFNTPAADSLYNGPEVVEAPLATARDEQFWVQVRTDSLTSNEQETYVNIDRLAKSKSFRRRMDLITLLLAGYKRAGPYAEIGPVNTFYSFNPVEGFRLRFGGRTIPNFSKRLNFETYAAYGFKDEKWKYYLGGTYSFTQRSIYEFPVVSLTASYQKDTKIPGQELQFVQEDNFLLSFKRGVNDRWLYNDIYKVAFLQEFQNHFSYQLTYKNWKQAPAGGLHYERRETTGHTIAVKDITTSEFGLQLRYAPHEEFYQGKLYRIPVINKYPVFMLRAEVGVKGLLNSEYSYQRLTGNIYKHFYLSQLGYTDVVLEGGYVFSKLPYALLDIHRANQSYSLQLESYNMMNFLEFVSDHYASVFVDHCFNGFLLNKIPLIKKAKLREYVSAKLLYGGLRDENNPAINQDLIAFPTNEQGNPTTFALNKEPYIEGSIGIGNIFNLIRIDLVKRFTYLDNPNVSDLGIRGRFKFDF